MARRVFYSFHYAVDNWRASQVRNIGVVDSNRPASDNAWESITKGGDAAIQRWIDDQLAGRSCTVVLIGEGTAGRKWIDYEIKTSWDEGKGLVGIYVHNLRDRDSSQSIQGKNPFDKFTTPTGVRLSSIVEAYNPPSRDSSKAYGLINDNLSKLIENAIQIRANY